MVYPPGYMVIIDVTKNLPLSIVHSRYREFSRSRPIYRNIPALGLILFLMAGCSKVQVAYRQLDWILPYYLGTYIELSDKQQSYVSQQVEELLQWHCATQLSQYADLLRGIGKRIQGQFLEKGELVFYLDKLKAFWAEVSRKLVPLGAEILLTSTDEQLDELFLGLRQRNEKWLVEYRETADVDLRQGYRKGMRRELERWFGDLTEEQLERIDEWSRSFRPLGEEGLRARQRWQKALHDSVELRSNRNTFHLAIEKLVNDIGSMHTENYKEKLEHNEIVTIDMVNQILRILDQKQKHHLGAQIASLADDLEELVCSEEATYLEYAREVASASLSHE